MNKYLITILLLIFPGIILSFSDSDKKLIKKILRLKQYDYAGRNIDLIAHILLEDRSCINLTLLDLTQNNISKRCINDRMYSSIQILDSTDYQRNIKYLDQYSLACENNIIKYNFFYFSSYSYKNIINDTNVYRDDGIHILKKGKDNIFEYDTHGNNIGELFIEYNKTNSIVIWEQEEWIFKYHFFDNAVFVMWKKNNLWNRIFSSFDIMEIFIYKNSKLIFKINDPRPNSLLIDYSKQINYISDSEISIIDFLYNDRYNFGSISQKIYDRFIEGRTSGLEELICDDRRIWDSNIRLKFTEDNILFLSNYPSKDYPIQKFKIDYDCKDCWIDPQSIGIK